MSLNCAAIKNGLDLDKLGLNTAIKKTVIALSYMISTALKGK